MLNGKALEGRKLYAHPCVTCRKKHFFISGGTHDRAHKQFNSFFCYPHGNAKYLFQGESKEK